MRTKTLLLSAVALLAAGIASTQAQPVYSQNVVGYANVPTLSASENYMMSVPFKIGVSNGANEIWPVVGGQPSIPDGSTLLVWDPVGNAFATYISDSGSPSDWDNASYYPTNAPILQVGQGFFLNPGGATTNVFAGTIPVNVGTSNQMNLASASENYMIGCVVPYGGNITNGNTTTFTGGLGLTYNSGLPDGSTLLIWDPVGNAFATYISDSGSPTFWDNASYYPTNPPSVTVGQAFYLNPGGAFLWTVGL